jgi:hypothetical protein
VIHVDGVGAEADGSKDGGIVQAHAI